MPENKSNNPSNSTSKYVLKTANFEGFEPSVYKDTKGKKTIGYGFNLDDKYVQNYLKNIGYNVNKLISGKVSLNESESKTILSDLYNKSYQAASKIVKNFKELPEEVQHTLADLNYNLGTTKLRGFKRMLSALEKRDYKTAAEELKNSDYYTQTGRRAKSHYEKLKTITDPQKKTEEPKQSQDLSTFDFLKSAYVGLAPSSPFLPNYTTLLKIKESLPFFQVAPESKVQPEEETYAQGGLIKRADGSYSKRGLWDNIRANRGSGRRPTKEMLRQERKIRAAEKKEDGGPVYNWIPPNYPRVGARNAQGGWLDQYDDGGPIKKGAKPLVQDEVEPITLKEVTVEGAPPSNVETQSNIAKSTNPKKNYAIVDKVGNRIYYYKPSGELIKSEPVITGKSNNDIDRGLSMREWFEQTGSDSHEDYFKYLEKNKYQTTPAGIFKISGKRTNTAQDPSLIGRIINTFRPERAAQIRESRLRDYGLQQKMFTLVDENKKGSSKAIHGTNNPVRVDALNNPYADKNLSNGCINLNGETICFDTLRRGSNVYIMPEEQTSYLYPKEVRSNLAELFQFNKKANGGPVKKGGKPSFYEKLLAYEENPDENKWEFVDPSGLTSWDDAAKGYASWKKSGRKLPTIIEGMDMFSAVPILGKAKKLEEGLKYIHRAWRPSLGKIYQGIDYLQDEYNKKEYGGSIEDQRIPTPAQYKFGLKYADNNSPTLTTNQMGTPRAYAHGATVFTKQTTPAWVAGTPTPTTTQREIAFNRSFSPGTAVPYPEVKIPASAYTPASPPVLQGYNPYNGPMRLHAPDTTQIARHGGRVTEKYKKRAGIPYAISPGVSNVGMYVGPTTQRGITFANGGWLDTYATGEEETQAGPTVKKAQQLAVENATKPYFSPAVVQSILAKANQPVTTTTGRVISTPASREKERREKIIAKDPSKYSVEDYKKGIQEPGAGNSILDDPLGMAIIATATGGAGLGSKAIGTTAKSLGRNLASEATLGATDLGRVLTQSGSFLQEALGEVLKGRSNKRAIQKGNAWLENWIKNPTTQAKIDADLPAISSNLYPGLTTSGVTGNKYSKNQLLRMIENQSKNFKPLSTEYSLSNQLVKPIHASNYGVSYAHNWHPLLRDEIEKGLINTKTGENMFGSYISRTPFLSESNRIGTVVHEGTHDWVPDFTLKASGQSDYILHHMPEAIRNNFFEWKKLREAGKSMEEINKIMGHHKGYQGYMSDPTEMHARIMELRQHFGLRPEDTITPDDAAAMVDEITKMPKSKRPIDLGYFYNVIEQDPKKLANLFNRLWMAPPAVAVGAQAIQQDNNKKSSGGWLDNL